MIVQAIVTKYLPATNTRPSRIKATCERGSIIVSYPGEFSGSACHISAADALVSKFVGEDVERYGTHRNPWAGKRVCGALPNNAGYCHVFCAE